MAERRYFKRQYRYHNKYRYARYDVADGQIWRVYARRRDILMYRLYDASRYNYRPCLEWLEERGWKEIVPKWMEMDEGL